VFNTHAVLQAHNADAHAAAVESLVATGKLKLTDILALILKYGPAALQVLALVYGVISGGGTLDLQTLTNLLTQLANIPGAKDIITAILNVLHVPVPTGF
jgi:hypothetical protein